MPRLFLAIWPNSPTHRKLADVESNMAWPIGTRLTEPKNWHVTLHFIGNVPAERLSEIAHKLKVPFDPFFITLKRRVSWDHLTVLEPDSITAPLASLHQQLGAALRELHLPVESRPFRPHLTLGRKNRRDAQPKNQAVTRSETITRIRWKVKSYSLVKSVPGENSNYQIIRNYGAQ